MAKEFSKKIAIVKTGIITGEMVVRYGMVDFNMDGTIVIKFEGEFESFPTEKMCRFNTSVAFPELGNEICYLTLIPNMYQEIFTIEDNAEFKKIKILMTKIQLDSEMNNQTINNKQNKNKI